MATDANEIVPLRYKVARRFYEPLLLLGALDTTRGGRDKSETVSDNAGTNYTQLHRSFADAIAHICAYRNGSDYITAAALEKTSQGVVVWLAASTEIEEKVKVFLKAVLAQVQEVVNQDDADNQQHMAQLAEGKLSSMIIDFHMPRLRVYRTKIIKDLVRPCQKALAEYFKRNMLRKDKDTILIENLQGWLTKYFGNDEYLDLSYRDLINDCFKIRHIQFLKTISVFARQGKTGAQEFKQLYELLGKLGRPIKFSVTLIECAIKLSDYLIKGFTVEKISSSKQLSLPFRAKEETTIRNIVGHMFSSKEEQDDFTNRLSLQGGGGIADLIKNERSIKTRVHPELLLLNHFERNKCNFLNDHEKYIGCSRPACYLCHMYIAQHQGCYVVSPCHNKLSLAWRAPDVFVGDTNSTVSLATQERIILKMINNVREDVIKEIHSCNIRRSFHAYSNASTASSLDSDDGSLSSQTTYPNDQGKLAAHMKCAKGVAELDTSEESDCDADPDPSTGGNDQDIEVVLTQIRGEDSKIAKDSGSESEGHQSIPSLPRLASITALTSLTSFNELAGTREELTRFFQEETSLAELYETASQKVNIETFTKNVTTLLKTFAKDLCQEATKKIQLEAIGLKTLYAGDAAKVIASGVYVDKERVMEMGRLRYQRQDTARKVESFLQSQTEALASLDPETGDFDNAGGSKIRKSNANEDGQIAIDQADTHPNLFAMEDFFKESLAFHKLVQNFRNFLNPNSGEDDATVAKVKSKVFIRTWKPSDCFIWDTIKNIVRTAFLPTPLPPGITRIEWTCQCGYRSCDDFTLPRRQILQLAKRMQEGSAVTKVHVTTSDISPLTRFTWTMKNSVINLMQLRLKLQWPFLILIFNLILKSLALTTTTAPNTDHGSTESLPDGGTSVEGDANGFAPRETREDGRSFSELPSNENGHDHVNNAAQASTFGNDRESGDNTPSTEDERNRRTIYPNIMSDPAAPSHRFLHLCLHTMPGILSLNALQLTPPVDARRINCDQELFKRIRQVRLAEVKIWSGLSLQGIYFIKFQLRPKRLIDNAKEGALPPKSNKDYDYSLEIGSDEDYAPPGSHWMMHLYHNPEHASDDTLCFDAFPKKKREPVMWIKGQANIGCAVACSFGLIFGIAWNSTHMADQSAFNWTVVTWITMVVSLFLEASEEWLKRKYLTPKMKEKEG